MSWRARCTGDQAKKIAGSRVPRAAEGPAQQATMPGGIVHVSTHSGPAGPSCSFLPLSASCCSHVEQHGLLPTGGLGSCCSLLAYLSCLPFRIQLERPLFQEAFSELPQLLCCNGSMSARTSGWEPLKARDHV